MTTISSKESVLTELKNGALSSTERALAELINNARTGEFFTISSNESVLTQHNNNARTGAYLAETQLKPSNVNQVTFGPIYSLNVSGTISAQPLYAKGVFIDGKLRNVLYVATRNNMVYAFDANNTPSDPTNRLIWTREFKDNRGLGAAPLPGMDDAGLNGHACGETHGPVGITSTPVIDPNTNTMYLVYRTGLPPDADPTHHNEKYRVEAHYWIASIDLRDGKDQQDPVEITFPEFDPNMELNRPGLLLLNGVIYLGFGLPVCDSGGNPWLNDWEKPKGHGWVFAYRANDLKRLDAFSTTQKTALGGIWQSGNGLAGETGSNVVYAFTGNNGVSKYNDIDNTNDTWIVANDPNHITELGESILKLRLGPDGKFVRPVEHFTAGNWYRLDTGMRYPGDPLLGIKPKGASKSDFVPSDSDLGSGGPVILPNGWIIGGGKQGRLYVIDPADMTHAKQGFTAFINTWRPDIDPKDYDKGQSYGPNIHGSPVVWHPNGANYALVYGMPEKDYLRAFKAYDDGHVDERPAMTTESKSSKIRSPDGMPGGFLSLSANGGRDGIIWAVFPEYDATGTNGNIIGRLIAFNALTLDELWEANDKVPFAKFVPPTIADGKVFRVAYENKVVAYGLDTYSFRKFQGGPVNSAILRQLASS